MHQPFRAIPKEFYSAETDQPFDRCIECNKYLLDDATEYLVEKVMKNYVGYEAVDTIFDYAICMDCAHAMHQKMSTESLQTIQNYFMSHVDLKQRMEQGVNEDIKNLTAQCLIKGTPRSSSTEYQLYAHCKGDKLFMGNPPYLISGEAMEEVMEMLSSSTKDELGGFMQKHFAPDPDLFQNTPRFILV